MNTAENEPQDNVSKVHPKGSMEESLSDLKACLSRVPTGAVEDPDEVCSYLMNCWDDLAGHNDGGMATYKLNDRMEAVEWNPPFLEFDIERHGARVIAASVYAEVQHWRVNVDLGTAEYGRAGRRVVGRRSEGLNVQPIAKEIAQLVIDGGKDARLKWGDSGTVRVLIGMIIPAEGPKQTVASRRKKFWVALETQLRPSGWVTLKGRSGKFTRGRSRSNTP